MHSEAWLWIPFLAMVAGALALDLGVFNRKAHAPSTREATAWSAGWIGLALAFNVLVYFWLGRRVALEFLAGYLIEKSLSVDNIFVFLMVFSYFSVPREYQHRLLFWGVLGAILIRGAFVVAGAALLAAFHWVNYLFGGFLVYTGIRMAVQKDHHIEPERHPVFRLARRHLPMTERFHGAAFFVRERGRLVATPLVLVLIFVELTDVVFAIDSVPAVFAVSSDPFIVYTSNIFAILGLRALYFLLAGIMPLFRFLKYALAVILSFVGVKMAAASVLEVPIGVSLGVIFGVLAVAVVASVLLPAPGPAAARDEQGRQPVTGSPQARGEQREPGTA
ncbi:MAG: TerC family protein [Limnochordaceae bacterium]|nr:TerC family protein [Limnochordaceae bacterium]